MASFVSRVDERQQDNDRGGVSAITDELIGLPVPSDVHTYYNTYVRNVGAHPLPTGGLCCNMYRDVGSARGSTGESLQPPIYAEYSYVTATDVGT
jgi:hypothetical protein